jgi:ABC-type nitrate/sulfonate/bicarbonate transport system permease component
MNPRAQTSKVSSPPQEAHNLRGLWIGYPPASSIIIKHHSNHHCKRREAIAMTLFWSKAPIRPILLYLRTMILVVLIWWAASTWMGRPYLLPSPFVVADMALRFLTTGRVTSALAISGQRLLTAYVFAALFGITLGLGMGLSAWIDDLFDWMVEMIRPISGIAWIPVLLVVFGISNMLPLAIIFYAAFFPFVLNTASGARHVDPALVNAARVLGAGPWRTLWEVILPATVPDIITGARIAASNAWMALIVSELVGAPNGLGFAVGSAQELSMTQVLAWIVYIGICGYALDSALQWIQVKLTPWRVGLKVGD